MDNESKGKKKEGRKKGEIVEIVEEVEEEGEEGDDLQNEETEELEKEKKKETPKKGHLKHMPRQRSQERLTVRGKKVKDIHNSGQVQANSQASTNQQSQHQQSQLQHQQQQQHHQHQHQHQHQQHQHQHHSQTGVITSEPSPRKGKKIKKRTGVRFVIGSNTSPSQLSPVKSQKMEPPSLKDQNDEDEEEDEEEEVSKNRRSSSSSNEESELADLNLIILSPSIDTSIKEQLASLHKQLDAIKVFFNPVEESKKRIERMYKTGVIGSSSL